MSRILFMWSSSNFNQNIFRLLSTPLVSLSQETLRKSVRAELGEMAVDAFSIAALANPVIDVLLSGLQCCRDRSGLVSIAVFRRAGIGHFPCSAGSVKVQ